MAGVEQATAIVTDTRQSRVGDARRLIALGRLPAVSFTLLPAVDVADGQAVRLIQGEAGTETGYGDPLDAALAWQGDGAEWIHLVDLDAAFGRGSNAELLAAVIGKLDVAVELSGGIRDDDSLERALSTGCARVNLGTAALEDPDWCARAIAAHGERIAVGLDVRITDGRAPARRPRLDDRRRRPLGHPGAAGPRRCARYVVTDVSKDGTLRGPNVDLLRGVAAATPAPVIASGGIAEVADLVALAEAAATGVEHRGLDRRQGALRRPVHAARGAGRGPRGAARGTGGRLTWGSRCASSPAWTSTPAGWSRASTSPTCATPATRSRWPASTTPRAPTS